MKQKYKSIKRILQLICLLLTQSCISEDPTILSGKVVDTKTDAGIPGVTVLISAYEKAPFLTLPGIIREDTLISDSQGKFRLMVPYNEQYSRFTVTILKEVASDTF
jgi:hypothetical protein